MQCKNLPLKNQQKRMGGIFHPLSYEFSDHDYVEQNKERTLRI